MDSLLKNHPILFLHVYIVTAVNTVWCQSMSVHADIGAPKSKGCEASSVLFYLL